MATADSYLAEHKFFDYEIMSTLGFEQEDVEALAEEKGVAAAEGAVSVDLYVYLLWAMKNPTT